MKTPTALLCFLLACARHATAAEPMMEDVTLHDEKRGRDIECRVHFPAAGDKLPLIVFSHGFGADRTAFTPIAQHWAAHGYVVVAPSHSDGFGKSKGDGPPAGGLAGLMKNAALKTENRVGDLVFVMDSTALLTAKLPALRGRVDPTRIGEAGHSLGAYTISLLGGVTADIGEQKARSFKDDRVRCILPISGQGTGQQGLTDTSWNSLKVPMMTITGSLDKGAGGQGPEWKKEPFKFSPSGDKYLVFIEGANHVSFGGTGSRDPRITDAVKAFTLAFWDRYLKAGSPPEMPLADQPGLAGFKQTVTFTAK